MAVVIGRAASHDGGVRSSGIGKRASYPTLRHFLAAICHDAGYDGRPVQELLGHRDVSTTMIFTHVLSR